MAYIQNLFTNGEHDVLRQQAFTAVPGIAASLRNLNAIECVKELHACGKMSDEVYCRFLCYVLKKEGFTWSEDEISL